MIRGWPACTQFRLDILDHSQLNRRSDLDFASIQILECLLNFPLIVDKENRGYQNSFSEKQIQLDADTHLPLPLTIHSIEFGGLIVVRDTVVLLDSHLLGFLPVEIAQELVASSRQLSDSQIVRVHALEGAPVL